MGDVVVLIGVTGDFDGAEVELAGLASETCISKQPETITTSSENTFRCFSLILTMPPLDASLATLNGYQRRHWTFTFVGT